MSNLKLDETLLLEIEKDIKSFVGTVIDISTAPEILSSHLDANYASSRGVTSQELSIQVAENRIRKVASRAKVEVICLFSEQVEKDTKLLEQLRINRIILLK